jgi:hypothetical protein
MKEKNETFVFLNLAYFTLHYDFWSIYLPSNGIISYFLEVEEYSIV